MNNKENIDPINTVEQVGMHETLRIAKKIKYYLAKCEKTIQMLEKLSFETKDKIILMGYKLQIEEIRQYTISLLEEHLQYIA